MVLVGVVLKDAWNTVTVCSLNNLIMYLMFCGIIEWITQLGFDCVVGRGSVDSII